MAIQHARVCGACERECPSWANRCPACGSTAISYQMIIAPPSGTSITQVANNTPRVRRNRVAGATSPEQTKTLKAPSAGYFG
jgi:RNA polymerase subunit RPABC4/transcription elongation factor Spt4